MIYYVFYLLMSRGHAVISYENSRFYIQDLGSSNGTFINNIRNIFNKNTIILFILLLRTKRIRINFSALQTNIFLSYFLYFLIILEAERVPEKMIKELR